MVKGNLYTHIVRHHDSRIDILSELKSAWRSRPIDFKRIRYLQFELKKLEKKKTPKKKVFKTLFGELYTK